MSRLIVKNLPKAITDKKLKEHFSQKGLVTDVQLKYTKDGKFRRFAFIGFKTEEQALDAKEYFDKTCIDTCRISIEQCASLGDSSKPRSWSKYAPDSSKSLENDKNSKNATKNESLSETTDESKKEKKKKKDKNVASEVKEALEKHKDDPLFMEFLESHTSNKAVWKNDTTLIIDENKEQEDKEDKEEESEEDDSKGEEEEEAEGGKKKIADKVISDLQYMEALKKKEKGKETKEEKTSDNKNVPKHGPVEFFTVKLRGLAYNHKKKDIKQFFRPLKAKSIRVPPRIKGIAYVGFKTEQHLKKALLKNKSFIDGKQIFVTRYEKSEQNNDEKNENNGDIRWKKQEEALKDEETIAESGRMFIRNLSYTTTEDDIRKLFEKYGLLTEVNLPIDKVTRKPKGFGTITFLMPEHAAKAYSELDGSILDGRMLHLLPGKAKTNPLEQLDEKDLTYKQKKELKDKATAGSSHNWNTLFLGQNAVADAIASMYSTTKEKVLEDGSKGLSAAVKLALGETQLVQDTKNFLEEHGVCLDAFNQAPSKRSKTVLLVKNLPAATTVREIRQLFTPHGELGRVVMPPSGITALVEFLEPSEARKAFSKLAYTKFKHLPLYLEWAPDNSFTAPAEKAAVKTEQKTEKKIEQVEESLENVKDENKKKEESEEEEEEAEPDTTLFVKNINFVTTEEQLGTYFSKCGPLSYATIATKKDVKNPGGKLSMGYGFVRYKRKADADRALKVLQMTVLDGKTLELKRSERTLTTDVTSAKKTSKVTEQTGTKILIRNVPFQANVHEITELFKAFGELKAVRLPKKLIGVEKHRGFGFVEYYTKSEAKKAFKALGQSTHLYGRRLVLEWAQTEEGIEDIRKRTAKHFHQEDYSKRSKKSMLNPEEVGLQVE